MVHEPFKLLIVDSVMSNLRTDYVGRGELSERQQRLGQYMKRLKHVRTRLLLACPAIAASAQRPSSLACWRAV